MKRKVCSLTFRRFVSHETKVRKGFGSFHVDEDVEVLIRQSPEEYAAPTIYTGFEEKLEQYLDSLSRERRCNGGTLAFGKEMKSCYSLDPNWDFLNHGAFGAVLRYAQEEAQSWRSLCEEQPLRFFDRLLLPVLVHSVREVAQFINCPAHELLPLQNVTSGLNSVFHSVSLSPGDEILHLSLTYGSTKKMLSARAACTGATVRGVPYRLPLHLTKDEFLSIFSSMLSKRTKLIVLDQITSNTALALPVLEMAALVRDSEARGAVVVVDAAHSLWSQHVSIYPRAKSTISSKPSQQQQQQQQQQHLGNLVDAWLTNGHKWLSAPKGCAFMWISPRLRQTLRPAVISHGFDLNTASGYSVSDRLLSAFAWDGCRDYAALCTVSSVLRLWTDPRFSALDSCCNYSDISEKGPSEVPKNTRSGDSSGQNIGLQLLQRYRDYCRSILETLRTQLTQEWQLTESDWPATLIFCRESPMMLVPLPGRLRGRPTKLQATDADAFQLQEYLFREHLIEVPVKCLDGSLYIRLSAHVYNEARDYEKLVFVIKSLTAS